MPAGLNATTSSRFAPAPTQYWTLYRERRSIRRPICYCCCYLPRWSFFASSWLALYLSKQITRPVEAWPTR